VLDNALQTIRGHLASLTVSSNVEHGAELWVNGQRVAALPMREPVHVEAGTVSIEVRANGYNTAHRRIDATAGSSHRESLYSEAVEGDTQVRSGPAAGVEGGSSGSSVDQHANALQRTVGLAVLAGGAAFLLGGVGAHIYWQTRVELYNTDTECFYGGVQRSVRCAGVLDNANSAEIAAIVLYAVGGAAAIVGGLITVTAMRSTPRPQHARRVVCGPGPGSIGVACAGQF
jgi:hypothetical protein